MGREWLTWLAEILTAAGIRAGEEYPAGEWMEVAEPVAAVGLAELDCSAGTAEFSVRVLSPRRLGGWTCQSAGAKAAEALAKEGLLCRMGGMEYLSGNDCFCVMLTVTAEISCREGSWRFGGQWTYAWNEELIPGVEEFTAEQDLDRRLIGAFCQGEPVGVTPGFGGWKLTLVQTVSGEEPEGPAEPFTLDVTGDATAVRYSGCCWNSITRQHTRQGLRIERRGFALRREVK